MIFGLASPIITISVAGAWATLHRPIGAGKEARPSCQNLQSSLRPTSSKAGELLNIQENVGRHYCGE